MDRPAPTPRDAAVADVITALRRFAEASEHSSDAAAASIGLHRTDLRALSVLMSRQARDEETSASELGRMLHLSSASTTALVDRLVRSGHAQRARSETDRRRVLVSHTDSALTDGRRLFQPMGRHVGEALAEFDEDELMLALRVVHAATCGVQAATEDYTGRPA